VRLDEAKVKKVENFPTPMNLRQLRVYRKRAPYNWTEKTTCIQNLKKAPYYNPYPLLFNFNTDASGNGLDTILFQKDEDNKKYV
ncbi:3500_t:CDS:2, partial [Gigaspora rosea]